jgi:CheY-like chemotaxis protein
MSTALLIEDEFLIRELAEAYLEDAGFEVTVARDGREALDELAKGTQFDLLFTDIRMPGGIDGRDVAEQAKKLIPGLRIVYATGYSDGADGLGDREVCIEKPYTFAAVRRVLGELGFAEEASG